MACETGVDESCKLASTLREQQFLQVSRRERRIIVVVYSKSFIQKDQVRLQPPKSVRRCCFQKLFLPTVGAAGLVTVILQPEHEFRLHKTVRCLPNVCVCRSSTKVNVFAPVQLQIPIRRFFCPFRRVAGHCRHVHHNCQRHVAVVSGGVRASCVQLESWRVGRAEREDN